MTTGLYRDHLRERSLRDRPPRPLPAPVEQFLAAAEVRIRDLGDRLRLPKLGFVSSDFREVYRALRELRESNGVADRFCEWGSGLGVVAGLAALLGYEATGIEIQTPLVRESESLLEEAGLEVTILEGSFIPEDYAESEHLPGGEMVTVLSGAGAIDEVDLGIDEFDVIFAYPWPGEEELYFDIFRRYAASGSHLVTYHGHEGVLFHRKL